MAESQVGKERVVVGVDGSEQGRRALGWAVRYAELAGAQVEAVIAWQPPFSSLGGGVPAAQEAQLAERAGQVLDESVAKVLGAEPSVELLTEVGRGTAAQVLLASARGAGLLVVGHRGTGGFSGVQLGSVGQYCVQHAPCPVVVVRDGG
jgi:nucleotide-binding universal stress UspA family protein